METGRSVLSENCRGMPRIRIPFRGCREHFSEMKVFPSAAICFWHITETEEELAALLSHSPGVVDEAFRLFGSVSRRKEWMAVRVLLYAVMGRSVHLEYTSSGCPFLSGLSAQVSISHTGNYVALALTEIGRIGIDMELRTSRAHRLRKKFLTSDEEKILWKETEGGPDYSALSAQDRAVLLWSAKEAAYKYFAPAGRVELLRDIRLSFNDGLLMASCKECLPVEVSFFVSETLILTVCQQKW